MPDIYVGINEFVEVDGEALPKESDFFGGHYRYDDLPAGPLTVVNATTFDGISTREGKGTRRVTTRDELLAHSNEGW